MVAKVLIKEMHRLKRMGDARESLSSPSTYPLFLKNNGGIELN
jgi:hypothetical protein